MVFADIDINTLCVDPDDIEHRITPKTKAIVAVHYAGHPCGALHHGTVAWVASCTVANLSAVLATLRCYP